MWKKKGLTRMTRRKKKKSVAFKASSSSKNTGKSKKESSDDEDLSDIDDEAMALFVSKMGKFMKKKVYGAPIVGPKKKVIWVPKTLVTNL